MPEVSERNGLLSEEEDPVVSKDDSPLLPARRDEPDPVMSMCVHVHVCVCVCACACVCARVCVFVCASVRACVGVHTHYSLMGHFLST